MTRPGNEPWSPAPLANTQTIWPIWIFNGIYGFHSIQIILGLFVCCLVAYQSSCQCSTMGVGRQSRRVCFGAKPDKGFLDKKISPYPEVVRGRERELTTRPRRDSWWLDRREGSCGWTGEKRTERLAWKNGGAVNTRHRAERRGSMG